MCNLTQNYVGKQDETNLMIMTSKEHLLKDKQSSPYLLQKKFLLSSMLFKITRP